jgi:competence protein ComEC
LEKTLQKIPFLRISIALACGIVLYSFIRPGLFILLGVVFVFLGGLLLVQSYYNYRIASIPGVLIHLFFMAFGMLVSCLYNQQPVFYSGGNFYATVWEIPQEKPNSYQAVLRIEAFCKNDSMYDSGEKVMTWFAKNHDAHTLKAGDKILFNHAPQGVTNNNNPFEFDYKTYLIRKKVYRQVYLQADNWVKINRKPLFSLYIIAERTRKQLLEIYQAQELDENELHILSALTLGYKRGLDPETKRIFAAAGAMHVLAVSGLHVGIVFFVLNFFLGFLRKQKTGRFIFIAIVIFILWFYAFLTGLSPSVTRAATMFTFVVIGKNIRRQVNIYNSLAASGFFLLLFNPNILFEVGFQLSYAAVFGIAFLQPRLENLVTFKYKVFRYLYTLFTVSVAAQIATFPLSVFYFNQFPVYFWISNLFVIPSVTLLIPFGMALLIFHDVPFLSVVISKTINHFLGIIYDLLQLIENLPYSLLEFTFLPLELFFVIGLLFSVFVFIESRKIFYFKSALVFFLFILISALVIKTRNLFRNEIIVYNQPDNTIVHLISGDANYIISENEVAKTGFSMNMIETTVRKYRLEPPVFLTRNDTVENNHLFLRSSIIYFNGRVLQLGTCSKPLPDIISPDIIIGPIASDNVPSQKLKNQLYVSTRHYTGEETPPGINIYYLSKEGAFREKW